MQPAQCQSDKRQEYFINKQDGSWGWPDKIFTWQHLVRSQGQVLLSALVTVVAAWLTPPAFIFHKYTDFRVDLQPVDRRWIIGCQSKHQIPDKSVNYVAPPPLTVEQILSLASLMWRGDGGGGGEGRGGKEGES